jgi:hypothetical protein
MDIFRLFEQANIYPDKLNAFITKDNGIAKGMNYFTD